MKKNIILVVMMMVVLCIFAGCKDEDSKNTNGNDTGSGKEESITIRIGGLSGPTSMGLVKLMEDSANGETKCEYDFAELSTDPSAFVTPLAKGEIDIAAVPSNLASVIYNNTGGKVKVIAVNTLCVLSIVERADNINSMSDLKGKTIYATGQGATPEYTLRYLLEKNDVDPDADMTIKWCADTTEALSYIANDSNAVAMLPQPFVTVAKTKVEGLRVALDLNDEWNKVNSECQQITGVLVARSEFIEKHQKETEKFLDEYKESVAFLTDDAQAGAQLIEKYGIVSAQVAQVALPDCHIVCMTGEEMRKSLEGFLQILFERNPQSVGGKVPGEEFYFD